MSSQRLEICPQPLPHIFGASPSMGFTLHSSCWGPLASGSSGLGLQGLFKMALTSPIFYIPVGPFRQWQNMHSFAAKSLSSNQPSLSTCNCVLPQQVSCLWNFQIVSSKIWLESRLTANEKALSTITRSCLVSEAQWLSIDL